MKLPQLKVLWLHDNPCALIENYRAIVVKYLPNIMKLDNNPITPEERQACQGVQFSFGGYEDSENEAPQPSYQKNFSDHKYKESYENPAPVYNEKPSVKEVPTRSNYG